MEGEVVTTQDLFTFEFEGEDAARQAARPLQGLRAAAEFHRARRIFRPRPGLARGGEQRRGVLRYESADRLHFRWGAAERWRHAPSLLAATARERRSASGRKRSDQPRGGQGRQGGEQSPSGQRASGRRRARFPFVEALAKRIMPQAGRAARPAGADRLLDRTRHLRHGLPRGVAVVVAASCISPSACSVLALLVGSSSAPVCRIMVVGYLGDRRARRNSSTCCRKPST